MLCTPSVVGMLKERGWALDEIAVAVKQPITLVTRYWLEWRRATEEARAWARRGTDLDRLIGRRTRSPRTRSSSR